MLGDILEARSLMLREIATLAAERRDDEQARRIAELAGRFAATGDDAHAAAHVDFAFMAELAQAAGNLVFVLILNTIRDLYFGAPRRCPGDRAPAGAGAALRADRARGAARDGQGRRRRGVRAGDAQRERVEAALR